MADEKKTEEAPKPLTMGDLKKLIEDTVGNLVKTGKDVRDDQHEKAEDRTERKLDRNSDVTERVQAELAKIRDKEARDAKEAERDATLAELVTKTAEKAPVERRRVHKFMGWGE